MGFALPGPLGSYFFGPKLVRADVLVKDGGALHLYRVDRGFIRSKANGSLVLRERDGSLVTIAVAPSAAITVRGQPAAYSALAEGHGGDGDPGGRRPGNRGSRRQGMTAAEPAGSNTAATPGAQLLLVEDEESIGSLVSCLPRARPATGSPGCAPARTRSQRWTSSAQGS